MIRAKDRIVEKCQKISLKRPNLLDKLGRFYYNKLNNYFCGCDVNRLPFDIGGMAMNESLKKEMIDYGMDLDGALHRFLGMEEMYVSFLHKYVQDESISNMEKAYEQKDVEELFKAAHSIKGLSSNLGINPVWDVSSKLTEMTRNKTLAEVNLDEIRSLMDELNEKDKAIRDIIARL
jgi:HPt (histidine-containing phosphotransfer) domain-containing protein